MTGLMEAALRRIECLSPEEQDAIASQIIETLDDEQAWTRSFQEDPEKLRRLAREALEEHRRGETRPLDKLIGQKRRADFSDLVGRWTSDPAFDEVLAAQRQIDPDKWK
jgi:hypothetical protein